ncbi:MAG: Lacal_2735 family protein [Bacteroidetes bacterium]|nr:Lacal_2735 family protein [Bacteroidota bacterium]
MFSLFKKDPIKELINQRKKMLEEAMHIQRSGDLKLYAVKMEAIDRLEKELDELEQKNNPKL